MHLRIHASLLGAVFGFGVVASAASPQTPSPGDVYARPGPLSVATIEYDWHDDARNRDVPVKIYHPATNTAPWPIILFSHGLGGSREGYEYLGRHWASHGYVSVHPTHVGSDTSVLRGSSQPFQAMQRAAADPRNAINRPGDVSFVIDRLTALKRADERFKGRLALEKIGIAGHSFGGYTALAAAGQLLPGPGGKSVSLGDPRIKAAIAMSAPARQRDNLLLDRSYGAIKIPCFHMTGTKDDSPIGETRAADRRIPFDHMTGADNYLLTLSGGDHMVFSGRRLRPGDGARDARFHELILAGTTAFWDAYLKGDAAAKAWLESGGFKASVGADGAFEQKKGDAVGPSSKEP